MNEPALRDYFVHPASAPDTVALAGAGEPAYQQGRWTAAQLGALAARLAERGPRALERLGSDRLLAAWSRTVEELRDPRSAVRRRLDPALAASSRLSPRGLAAGLEAVLWGVRGEAAAGLWSAAPTPGRGGLTVVVLASNLPALAVQPLVRALAGGRAVLLKSASAEPLFAPAWLAALAAHQPELADAVAAVTWRGGDAEVESAVFAAASQVVAYGDGSSVAAVARRAPGKTVGHGPRLSLALVGPGADLAATARGLARDIALFDQRGCLSPHAVFHTGDGVALADALAGALAELAHDWPPGPIEAAQAGAVQQLRAEAEMRGLHTPPLELAAGTVVVESRPELQPSPGLRTVRLHALPELEDVAARLEPWRGQIQGVAVAGAFPNGLRRVLHDLGVTRVAAAGELQRPEAGWSGADFAPGLSA